MGDYLCNFTRSNSTGVTLLGVTLLGVTLRGVNLRGVITSQLLSQTIFVDVRSPHHVDARLSPLYTCDYVVNKVIRHCRVTRRKWLASLTVCQHSYQLYTILLISTEVKYQLSSRL